MASVPEERWIYALHGLTLSSVFPLHRIEVATGRPSGETDVQIRFGETPERLDRASALGFRWEISPDAALLDVANIARILITSREIVLSPKTAATIPELSFAVLAASLPPLLFLRRTLVLHAAAVRWGDRAIAIAGTSGVGKSTALFACLRRGGGLITDDVAAVHFSDAAPTVSVFPGAPGVKLWPDALDHYTVPSTSSEPIRPAAIKRVVGESVASAGSTPLAALVVLESHFAAMQCRRVSGRAAFNAVRSHIHGPRMVLAIDRDTAFRQVAAVTDRVPTFVLQRPNDLSAVGRIADTILSVT